jgi:hypothetical protein
MKFYLVSYLELNFHQSKLNKSFSPLNTKNKSQVPLMFFTGAEMVFHISPSPAV